MVDIDHLASLGILHLWKPPSITVRFQHFQSTPPLAELAADPVLARMADPTGPSFVKASLGGFQSHGAAWPILDALQKIKFLAG
jgi:hypothetical protein